MGAVVTMPGLLPVLPLLLVTSLPLAASITCYSCTLPARVVNGSCTEEGKSEWCEGKAWCVKTWRDQIGVSWRCADKGPADGYEGCTTERFVVLILTVLHLHPSTDYLH